MLVLARQLQQRILFPTLQIAVQVVEIKPNMVRLGIEAPRTVPVLREEVYQRKRAAGLEPTGTSAAEEQAVAKLHHLVRNRLSVARIGLALLKHQLAAGQIGEAEVTVEGMEQDMDMLCQRVEHERRDPSVTLRRARALLVEDNRNECELMAGFLRMAGIEVATAADGADALHYLRVHARPDVVLLDMYMPRSDGLTTAHAIREDPQLAGTKIFAVTGRCASELVSDRRAGDIDRWFQKPINPESLLDALREEMTR
jgi:carbon storage regulator CsrA